MTIQPPSRRDLLTAAAAASIGNLLPCWGNFQEKKRPKVAAVYTVFRHRSHAHDIIENFLEPYYFCGKLIDPGVDVVSFYADQRVEKGDMTEDVAKQYKVRLCKTIDEALCLGGKELAVDAVLSIGEHGEYPLNKLDQREYPRKRFFDEIVAVMKRSRRFVPIFNDKHLSFRWDWAKEMYDTAKEHRIPFMAGSSVPLAQRVPAFELPAEAELDEAVSVHGGGIESYDFHALEILQSLVESRKGGEKGVSSVEFLQGDALWQAAEKGRWSIELARAAMSAEFEKKITEVKRFEGEGQAQPHGILVTYRDGFRATALKLGSANVRWNFACRFKKTNEIKAHRWYVGPWKHRNLFKALSHAIQAMIHSGKPSYSIERTLLTTGILEAAMRSRAETKPMKTAHLEFEYQPIDFKAMRENGESWKIVTEATPELPGIKPNGGLKK